MSSSSEGTQQVGTISMRNVRLEQLHRELHKQRAIFEKHAGRAINPDGSDAYWAAKGKFDAADRRMKEIEKEIARILAGGSPNMPSGIQSSPSQSKTKVSPD